MEIDIKKEIERLKLEKQQNLNQLQFIQNNIVAISGILNYLEMKLSKPKKEDE